MSALSFAPCLAFADATAARDLKPPEEFELNQLKRTFRGFVAVAFPSDASTRCNVTEVSDYQRRSQEFFRSWFSVVIEASCPGIDAIRSEIWIQCTMRGARLDCALAEPSVDILASFASAVQPR